MSWRRNKEAVEAWKATQPQYERRAKRRLLHTGLLRFCWARHVRARWEIEAHLWMATWEAMERQVWTIPDFAAMESNPWP